MKDFQSVSITPELTTHKPYPLTQFLDEYTITFQVEGYIDLEELHELLDLYYAGTLDHVNDLSNLYKPLYQLIPGKTLVSQLLTEDINKALLQLPFVDEAIIEEFHKYPREYNCSEYYDSINKLAKVLYKSL